MDSEHVVLMIIALLLIAARHEKRKKEIELSKYIWKLKGEDKDFIVTWKVLAKAKPYMNTSKRYDLRITEKLF